MNPRNGITASFVALLVSISIPLVANGAGDDSRKAVLAADLANGTQIIGLLGSPLGQLMTVEARVVPSESKDADQYLEVLMVANHQLSVPLRLRFSVWQWGSFSSSPLPPNQVLLLRVYETGGMQGVPQNAMKETTYVTTVAWGFSTSVVILYEQRRTQ
jgi:hypothetical protein